MMVTVMCPRCGGGLREREKAEVMAGLIGCGMKEVDASMMLPLLTVVIRLWCKKCGEESFPYGVFDFMIGKDVYSSCFRKTNSRNMR
jgi:hypothetical protein